MRPIEFTDEAVIQAGLDLRSAGRNITGFALRNVFCCNTVAEFLSYRTWAGQGGGGTDAP